MVDHIMVGSPDLAAGVRAVEALTGVALKPGGVHPTLGTANSLLGLGERVYLEVIGPAPGKPVTAALATSMAAMPAPAVRTFIVAFNDLDGLADRARKAGLTVTGPTPSSRQTVDGQVLHWRLLDVDGQGFGGFLPLFIDWGTTPHPSATAPAGVHLRKFRVIHPRAAELQALYHALGIEITVEPGLQPLMLVELTGPHGDLVLSGDATIG